jgi:hypothetical protein
MSYGMAFLRAIIRDPYSHATSSKCTSGESEEDDFIAGLVICRDEAIRFSNILPPSLENIFKNIKASLHPPHQRQNQRFLQQVHLRETPRNRHPDGSIQLGSFHQDPSFAGPDRAESRSTALEVYNSDHEWWGDYTPDRC